jgi:glucosamine--fructose-6-phosphate aminotransferase (isomerizing)
MPHSGSRTRRALPGLSLPGSKMLTEIREQPTALSRTLTACMKTAEELRRRFEKQRPRLVVIVARGTSDNAAITGRYLIEITTGIPVSLAAPSALTLYGVKIDYRDALVVGISQSGESTDTNALVESARKAGAVTVGVTNEASSALAKIAEFVLPCRAGKENSIAATKTYTAQLLAMYLLSYALGGFIRSDELARLPQWVERVLKLESRIEEAAERYRFMTRTVTIARGLNYGNALEFGLKLMETCYVATERFSAADLMHGPIAIVEDSFPAFVFAPGGVTWQSIRGVVEHLNQLKGDTLVITDIRESETRDLPARFIRVPAGFQPRGPVRDLYTPIPYIVPAQLFAAHLSVQKGLDPDRPRALKKVTLTM